ncbi:MAG: thiol-activated cytolysin family protein [Gemmatimonadota bacterium]|nr:thiol-activated cytolysin family protein [Gemmatimonadota bacterium]
MRSVKSLAATLAVLALIGPACSEDASSPVSNATPNNSNNVNEFIASLPAWQQPANRLTSTSPVNQTITELDQPIPDYLCTVQQYDWAKADNEVFAPEQDFATLWPGAMFHGKGYRSGDLVPVDAPRSPISLYSNLPGSKSVTVDSPNSTTMNDAINEIRGSVAPGNYQSAWEFRVDEVYSNLQGTMEAGLNAGYAGVASGGLSFSESRSITRHVYFGRAVQRMFTIRFADDQLKKPSDFFDGAVTAQQLRDAGIGNSDVPVYVRSVTYGQLIVFKAELNTEQLNVSFKADLKASWEDFTAGGSGGGSNSNLLKQATYTAIGYGGDPGNSANAHSAVAEQKFGTFFDGATVQNAVPLFFEVVTLKDGEPANLGERVVYETWENCKAATGYDVTTEFQSLKANGKVDEKQNYEVDVFCGPAGIVPHIMYSGQMNFPVANKWYRVGKSKTCSMGVNAINKIILQYYATDWPLNVPTYKFDYPFSEIDRNTWLDLPGLTVEIRDGLLGPLRNITAQVRVKLVPTYD